MDPFAPKFYSPIQTNFTTCEHSFNFVHTFISFQDLYRILLEAESEGILDDLDMTKNGFLILNQRNVSIIEVISWLQTYPFLNICISFQDLYRVLLEAESAGIMDDVDMTQVEKQILEPKTDKKDSAQCEF